MQSLGSYEVINLALDVARVQQLLVQVNNRIRSIYLNDITGAAVLQIGIGSSGQPIALKENRPVKFKRKPFDGAITITHAAFAGQTAQLIIIYDDGVNDAEAFTIGAA